MSAANADSGLSEFGRASIFGLAMRFACSRLDLEDLIRRHPEIEQVDLLSPIIIAGLPRSGTTYMLQLMGADPRLRAHRTGEGIRPVADRFVVDGKDTRFDLAEAEWAELDELMPCMKMIHEFAPDHITEDIELIGADFAGYYPEWLSFSPQWRDYQMTLIGFPGCGTCAERYRRWSGKKGPIIGSENVRNTWSNWLRSLRRCQTRSWS